MKQRMITILSLVLIISTFCHAGWVEDSEMKFKINVPNNWKRSILKDGTDRIHVFLSPDENVAVRIRAFKVPEAATLDLIIPLFEQNILAGGERKALMDHTLNGMNGKVGAYTGTFDGTQVGAGAFFTIQNGIAYIVWSLTPISMFQSRYAESDAITNTFTLINNVRASQPVNTQGFQLFKSSQLGYSIQYPSDWVYSQSKPHIVIFSGKQGTPAYYTTVNIQNLASTSFGGQFNNMNDVMNHFQKQLFMGATNISMSEVSPCSLSYGGGGFLGQQIEMKYTRENTQFKQWLIIIPRHDQKIYYAFSYTASVDDYSKYLGVAGNMLKDWIIE